MIDPICDEKKLTKVCRRISNQTAQFKSNWLYCFIKTQKSIYHFVSVLFGLKIKLFSNFLYKGEYCLRTEDIISLIEREGDEICLILFPGIQYFTGQLFRIKEITDAAHRKVNLLFYTVICPFLTGYRDRPSVIKRNKPFLSFFKHSMWKCDKTWQSVLKVVTLLERHVTGRSKTDGLLYLDLINFLFILINFF